MNDRVLVALFRRFAEKGDGRALAAVFDATSKELLELACHLVRDPAEAEDLVQAAFLTAIAKAERYDGRSPVQAWLYGILWREAAKTRRRAARRLDPRELDERAVPDPLDLAAEREVPAAVEEALARLPRHFSEVLRPLLFEEKRPEHIARDLARSPGTVRSQIHRGLEALRRSLAPRLAANAAFLLPTRGLESVRASVLKAAGFPATTTATPVATAIALTAGGIAVSKSAVVGAAAAAALLTGTWMVLESTPSQAARGAGEPELARAEDPGRSPDGGGGGATGPAVSADAAAGERESAPVQPAPAPSFEETVAFWLGRFDEAPDDWRHGWAVAEEIAKLPPDEARAVMEAVWEHLSVPVKEQVLKPFVFHGGRPNALPLLHLAATDAATSVQERAFGYLRSYAFRDFTLDYQAYLEWEAANRGRPVADVVADSARSFVAELLVLTPAQQALRMLELDDLDLRAGEKAGVDLAAEIRAAGGERLLESALAHPDPEVVRTALRWSAELDVDERWLRTWVLPEVLEGDSPNVGDYLEALGRPGQTWAREPVLAYLGRATQERRPGTKDAARALAEIGDPAAIPGMIEVLLRDRTGELAYDVGHFGLAELTGVRWQESYDGEWWLDWWERNRARFPAEVAALSVRR